MTGLHQHGTTVPFAFKGAMNGPMPSSYVSQRLVPTLQRGDIVAMDNRPVHKATGAREAIEASGSRLLYQLPYSPNLNPIEVGFGKLDGGKVMFAAAILAGYSRTVPCDMPSSRPIARGPSPDPKCAFAADSR